MMARQPELAAHIRQRRLDAGFTTTEVNSWFPNKSQWTGHWESPTSQPLIPTPEQWAILKANLNLADGFDDMIKERSTVEYDHVSDHPSGTTQDATGRIYNRLPARKDRRPISEWSDCGHSDFRPGLVLDPFAGTGTTLAVAHGHGRDAIGIDIDSRSAELARDRVGPLFLEVS